MLDEHKIGALVITGAGGELRGVVSERDIARAIARHGAAALDQSVDHIMTSKVVTAAPNDTIDVMMGCMTERRIRHLPVLEQGRLVGLVSIGDIVKAKIEAAEAENEAIKTYITSGV
ncbi:MAG: CBS domain-containing protein [Caulobacterales bacterium]|nr:CBS domain-containing protein [Caulobacterales bacterium]